MVWKTGKLGVNNGRTVRSARTPGKRSEGLLIQTTTFSEGSRDQGEPKTIIFSLGKQNRWLLPEVIKENSIEVEKDEVVLVQRPDCFSVYNSKSTTTRKSKGKFAQANDLLSGTEEIKTRYEVSYPHPSGSWQNEKQWRRQTKHLGARKKNSFPNWSFEMENEEVDEPFLSCQEIDEDFSEQFYSSNSDRSVTLDLGLLLKNSTQKKQKCSAKTKQNIEAEKSKELPLRKGECIYIESCDEMYDAHHELLAQIQETSYDYDFYEADEWTGGDPWYLRGRGEQHGRRGHGRGGWRGRGRGRGRGGVHHYIPNQTLPSADSETSEPSTKFTELLVEDSYEQFASVDLTCSETDPTFLKEQWGEKYKEAASLPRAFILNVMPDTCQCNGGEIFVLFKVDCMTHDTRKVKAWVSTVVICNEEGMHESVLAEFISKIKARSTEADICSLEEVVNIAKCCFYLNTDNKANESKPKQPKLSLDVFTKLFGWSFKAFSLKRAQQEVKTYLTNRDKNQPENAQLVVPTATANHAQQECTICFMEFQPDDINLISHHTSLTACGHQFCNSCWRAHLKTLIEHGSTELQCPGHKCITTVDHVTLMSLVPSLYGRHLAKRLDTFLEMDPQWKWCPADQCKLVFKASSSQDTSGRLLTSLDAVQPVPVVCVCGTMWCFKCQEDAHWPATCDEARIFRQRNEGYAKMIINSQSTSLITSVNVKNCPFCHYPIEKGPGCNHMVCGLCSQEFCWWCLQKWDWDHVCEAKQQVTKREVELPVDTKHLKSYEYFAVTSRIARSTALINKVNKKLDRLEQSIKIYGTLSPKVKEDKPHSGCAKRRMNHFTENNRVKDLREVFSFKFQALLALEGLAIVLSFMKDCPNKRLVWEFDRLFFIIERLSETLQDLNTCVHQVTLEKLKHFVACGKDCLFVIDRKRKQFIKCH